MTNKKEYYSKKAVKAVKAKIQDGLSAAKATQIMCKEFGFEYNESIGRYYRHILQKQDIKSKFNTEQSEELKVAKTRQYDCDKQRFIISWAQQDTPIHEQFFSNIEAYAKHIDADIHIICGRYKNSTSLEGSRQQKKSEESKTMWHPRLQPYLDANRQQLHEHLQLLADIKVQPTAVTPLTGFNSITGLESCIIGHPSIHLKSLPVLPTYPNKLLITTGAVTLPNYSDTKSGKKGEFNHVLGFCIVEKDGEIFHIRQVQCDESGSFYDLTIYVFEGEVYSYFKGVPAVVFGDLHLGQEDNESVNLAFDLVDSLGGADKIIVHDVFDGHSVSGHDLKDPFVLLSREEDGSSRLQTEIDYMVAWFKERKQYDFVSVMSNHCEWLDRWVRQSDWRKTNNKKLYLELSNVVASGKADKGLVPYILDTETDNVVSLGYDDSYRLAGWELALHYDKGANGSRGSVMQFKNLNTKSIGGHGHTPERQLGSIMVGTLTEMKLGYNKGLSSWLAGVVVIYPNGKASHINFVKGKYTTLY